MPQRVKKKGAVRRTPAAKKSFPPQVIFFRTGLDKGERPLC
jgi:hypothetical protein